jgi:hypothetical protein
MKIERFDQDVYLNERRDLIQQESEQSRSFDRAILTLTGGALGLSLAFIKDAAPNVAPCTTWLLYAGWFLLIASLLMTLSSFQMSATALRRQRRILDDIQSGGATPESTVNIPGKITGWLNVASLVSFTAGTAALTLFVALSLHSNGV